MASSKFWANGKFCGAAWKSACCRILLALVMTVQYCWPWWWTQSNKQRVHTAELFNLHECLVSVLLSFLHVAGLHWVHHSHLNQLQHTTTDNTFHNQSALCHQAANHMQYKLKSRCTTCRNTNTARDLGVVIDRSLTMSDHVTAVWRAAYFQLRQLRLITHSLTADAAKLLVQACITCRLDYCNSLFCGISDSLFRRLQSVQNAGHNWHQPMRPHHTSVEATPLVTSSTACQVQISRAHLQVSSWPHGAISDWRLSTGR